jgi:type I restriction enzyme S subunit
LIQWNAGGTYPAIEEDIPLRILVPDFPSDVVAIQGRRLAAKLDAGVFAERLCRAAIYLVEALFESRLSEVDLKAAEQQLEQGNRELDRAILSRITASGVDAEGAPPLFIDPEALYAAIGEAERAHTDGETL